MRILQFTLTAICFMLLVSSASAEYKKAPNAMDHQAMMDLYKKLATPGEPHKLFASLVGSWATKTKEWMEPNKPPMESEGTVESKMLLDGRYLYSEYQGTMMGQPFQGIAIDAYDNLTKHYSTIWMSTSGTNIFMMEGTANSNGKVITLRGQHEEPGGGVMKHRAIWKIIDEKSQTFEMYGAHHGSKEMKMMEIVYTRKN